MSAEIVIILIGVVLLFIAIGDSINIKDSSLGLINPNLRIPMGVMGLLLLIYGGYSYGSINLQGQIEQVVVGNKLEVESTVNKIQVLSPVEVPGKR